MTQTPPHIQCARCHGTLAKHVADGPFLVLEERECIVNVEQLREQIYAWAEYALGYPHQARDRNYTQRVDYKGGPTLEELRAARL